MQRREYILGQKAQILTWIFYGIPKGVIASNLGCRPDTLNSALKEMGINYKGVRGTRIAPINKRMAVNYLYLEAPPIHSHELKVLLIRDKIKEYRCETCKKDAWEGKLIPLELHHINGNRRDNRLENIKLLCANCHALTLNYSGKNNRINLQHTHPTREFRRCVECQEVFYGTKMACSKRCASAFYGLTDALITTVHNGLSDAPQRANRPVLGKDISLAFISGSITQSGVTQTARNLGVSASAIRQVFKRKNVEFPRSPYRKHADQTMCLYKDGATERSKIEWPSGDEVYTLVQEHGYRQAGQMLGFQTILFGSSLSEKDT